MLHGSLLAEKYIDFQTNFYFYHNAKQLPIELLICCSVKHKLFQMRLE